MFNMNILGELDPLSIYTARPDGSLLGCIDDIIDEQTASLSIGINQQYTLMFEINTIENQWDEYLQEGMFLLVDKVGLFKIAQPSIVLDGVKETKTITAYSCDSELEDKTCTLPINMGTEESMEYLVKYNSNEDEELVNAYTGIPYDWILLYNTLPEQLESVKTKYNNGHYGSRDSQGEILVTNENLINELTELFTLVPRLKNKVKYIDNDSVLEEFVITRYTNGNISSYTLTNKFKDRILRLIQYYTNYRNQLSLLDIVLESTGGAWTVGDISGLNQSDYSLANSKFQFDINESIYSFLTNTLATTINCVVNFDILNRRVNITKVEEIGNDTGIVIGYDTLVKTLNIQTDEDKLATRLRVFGGNELEIARVNFGSNYVFDLSYKMNAIDTFCNRIYVSDELAAKYTAYMTYLEDQRTQYISLSKSYEEYLQKIDEIKYRVPNDGLQIDWGTYHQDELTESLKQFKNQLATLISLYKNDYYSQGVNSDGSINETFMKTTMYWYDYKALNNIIDEVECAIAVYPNYSDQTVWTAEQVAEYSAKIRAWETEWTLFGSHELKAKIDAYKQNMDLLAEQSVIRVSNSAYTIKTWDQLSTAEKAEFDNDQILYKYDSYMVYYNYMISAQAYLDTLLSQISSLESQVDSITQQRNTILNNVNMESYFTNDEYKTICRLFRDSDYTNENIITTSIDTPSEKLDHMVELLEDAKDKVSETSRPQVTFTVESDNLLALPEFEPMWGSFKPGNYILVQYKDNEFVKVRLIGYTFNPRLVSSDQLTMTFSNFTQSRSYYRDWASLLNNNSTFSGSLGGGSTAASGTNTLDDSINNTLLTKLLNSETFGTRVTDVILDTIDVNVLTARTAKFGGLANGTTLIDGKCIQTGYIIDALYNGVNGGITNTQGSIINLETGMFNLGGGNIVYNGSGLTIKGAFTADSLSAGGKTYASHEHNGLYIDSSGNIYAGSNNATRIFSDGTFNLASGRLTWNGTVFSIKGKVIAENGYLGTEEAGFIIDESGIYSGSKSGVTNGNITLSNDNFERTIGSVHRTNLRFAVAGKFAVDADGKLYASDGEFTGKIYAAEGYIGGNTGWHIVSNKIYSGTVDGGVNDGDITLSTVDFTRLINNTSRQGLRFAIGQNFGVNKDGTLYANGAVLRGNFTADTLTVADTNKNVFEWIDDKTKLWYGSINASYPDAQENDYLVDTETGCTYRFNGTDWVGVTDYKSAIEDSVATLTGAMEELSESLQDQIDAKVQTWSQDTNPGASWTSDEREAHNGDLWFYTGTSKLTIGGTIIEPTNTYQYNSSQNKWTLYSSSSLSLFDVVDGKKTIFYGSPSGSYSSAEEGDYLVDKSTNTTYERKNGSWEIATSSGNLYGTVGSSIAASTTTKVVTCTSATSLYDGLIIRISFTNGNTSNTPYLNVNNLGAVPIYINGTQTSSSNKLLWTSGAEITFMYGSGHFTPIDAVRDYYATSYSDNNTSYKYATSSGMVVCKGTTFHVTFNYLNTRNPVYLSIDSSGSGYNDYMCQITGLGRNWNDGDTVSFGFTGQYWGDDSAITTVNSYMKFESNKGLMIANMRNGVQTIDGVSLGVYNTLLKSDCLQIRNGTKVLAEYGNGIKIYAPNNSSTVAVDITSSYATFGGSNGINYNYTNNKVTLGSNVAISWDALPSDAAKTSDIPNNTEIANTAKGAIDKTYIDGLGVIAKSISAVEITGKTITGSSLESAASNGATVKVANGQIIFKGGDTISNAIIYNNGKGDKVFISFGVNSNKSTFTLNCNVFDAINCAATFDSITINNTEGISYFKGAARFPWAVANPATSSDANARLSTYTGDMKGQLMVKGSSSIRYKTIDKKLSKEDIYHLYDLPTYWFKYKDGYLSKSDERNGISIPGFIVEDWQKVFPIAVDHIDGNIPEMWNSQIVIPVMFEMIKNNHSEINALNDKIHKLESIIDDFK